MRREKTFFTAFGMLQNEIQYGRVPIENENPTRNSLFRKILRTSPCSSRFWPYPAMPNPRKLQKANILLHGYEKIRGAISKSRDVIAELGTSNEPTCTTGEERPF